MVACWQSFLVIVASGVFGFMCYLNSVSCSLAFDDHLAIETNPDVTDHSTHIFAPPPHGLFFHDFWGKNLHHEASHKVHHLSLNWSLAHCS